MNLSDFCRRITGPDTRLLPENHKLGARLICPEYSKSVQEVKTYPLPVRTAVSYYAGTLIFLVICMQQ